MCVQNRKPELVHYIPSPSSVLRSWGSDMLFAAVCANSLTTDMLGKYSTRAIIGSDSFSWSNEDDFLPAPEPN